MRVSVGIHVHAEPERLSTTLRALSAPSAHRVELLVLPDGPDPEARRALASLEVTQCGTEEPRGAPACFNRLAAWSDSDVVILLESGAIPAPGALDRLVEVLGADSRNGIAGPSTNEAWNEQRAIPWAAATPAAVARAGKWLAGRHGGETRSLAPLHSLSDFCYAVRREVIVALGGADEGYALGPCWEMEYTARAMRAGFRALWVCGAYVYRAPFTSRRRLEEDRRFEASKRRYQDSLCALRLLGQRSDYEPHCRGDACEHFAPASLIQLRRPLPPREACPTIRPAPPAPEPVATVRPARPSRTPQLVSCVMPTRNRAEFALQAIRLFQSQDYEARELIIVDDGDDGLGELLPDDPRVRYIRAPRGESIGAKRNLACAQANGDFLVQWDDDDWYAPDRLSAQLGPLIERTAEITGLRSVTFFELEPWRFWTVSDALHRRLFREDVHGGTLAFTRRVWAELAQYPPASLAEDAAFLTRARMRRARLEHVDGRHLCLYLRHAQNAWHFCCGEFLDPAAWRSVSEPPLPSSDRAFYAARSGHAPPPPNVPMVSCIMPTADRRRWVPTAIEYFLRQDYPNRELIVLDDGEDRVADLIPRDPRIRYVALERRLVLGEKRNRACELARGEIIVHWDDDDWQAPYRLRYQVDALQHSGSGLCGADKTLYFAPDAGQAWLYCYPERLRTWVAGSSLCYRRALWQENRFAPVGVGEDTRFVWDPRAGKPHVLRDHRFYAALIHSGNSSQKVARGSFWQPRAVDEVRSLFGLDWARYQS
jgi:O-antigen biosynthesis protein